MDSIFETKSTVVQAKDRRLISFSDCPNSCTDGKIFDFRTHTERVCEYCAKKRREMVNEGLKDEQFGDINKVLNLPESFSGYTVSVDDLFAEVQTDEYTEESIIQAKDELKQLLNNIATGVLPEYSIAIQLPHLFAEYDFISSYLIRSYLAGLDTVPMLSPIDIIDMRRRYVNGHAERDGDTLTFDRLLKADTVVIYIDNGASSLEFDAVFGFTNLRSNHYKPSILVFKKHILKKDNFGKIPNYKLYNIIELEKIKREEKLKSQNSSSKSIGIEQNKGVVPKFR